MMGWYWKVLFIEGLKLEYYYTQPTIWRLVQIILIYLFEMTGRHYKKDKTIGIMLVLISDLDFKKMLFIIRLGKVLKIIENCTKGPPPQVEKNFIG